MCGYTTAIVAAAATIASMAVPPLSKMSLPTFVAIRCGAVNAWFKPYAVSIIANLSIGI
jgi:hypothetical protein